MFRGLNADPLGVYLKLNNGVWYIDMLKSRRNLMLCTDGCFTGTRMLGVYIMRTVLTRNVAYGGEVLVITTFVLYFLIPVHSY